MHASARTTRRGRRLADSARHLGVSTSDTALHGELSLAMQLAVHARGSRQLELKERLPRGVDLLDALGAQAERFAQHQPEELVDGDAVGARGED